VQFHATKSDPECQAANGATVNASKARGGADADAFAKGGNRPFSLCSRSRDALQIRPLRNSN